MDTEDETEMLARTALEVLSDCGERLVPYKTLLSEVNVRVGSFGVSRTQLELVVARMKGKGYVVTDEDPLTGAKRIRIAAEGRAWLSENGHRTNQ